MGLFGRKAAREPRPRLTDPAMLRSKGVLGKARVLEIESKASVGGTMADPAYHCTLTLEVLPVDAKPYPLKVQQRMARSALAQLTGDDVVAPAWIDPVNPAKVAIDIAAGPVESATGAGDVRR
jgi:hypothetical protein